MCGIFGIYSNFQENLVPIVFEGLKNLQHRGNDGCGIGFNNTNNTILIKNYGLVNNLFQNNNYSFDVYKEEKMHSCIGQVRYSTSGIASIQQTVNSIKTKEIQPLSGINNENKRILIAHNGNIPTFKNLFDTQEILNLIINSKNTIENTLINLIKNIPCAYCLLIVVDDILYVVRDRYGIRPLSYGLYNNNNMDKFYCIGSETCSLHNCINIKDVNPGEIIKFDSNGINQVYQHNIIYHSLCAFEILYLMNPKSGIYNNTDHTKIESIRIELGELMAKKEINKFDKNKEYIVIGIPNSGIIYGQSYAKFIGYPYLQLIEKDNKENYGEDRTFILINEEERKNACRKNLKFNEEILKNKNIILIDDTIVRGNIITTVINKCKLIGVNEIHIRIPSPPVIDKCELGIAIHSKQELIMNNRTIEDVRNLLGVDSLNYLSIQDLSMFPKQSYMNYFGKKLL